MTNHVDPSALLKFQFNELQQQAQILSQDINQRRTLAVVDVLNAIGQMAANAAAGDEGARRFAKAWFSNVEALRAAAESKITLPPGVTRKSVEFEPTVVEAVDGTEVVGAETPEEVA
jgi:hypothetical protein